MFFGKKKIIGLDIGSSAVRVMEIKQKKRPLIKKYGVQSLPEGAMSKGTILNGEAVTKAIRAAVKKAGITTRNVIVGIESQQVVLRHVKFPKMKESELKEAIKWEAEHHLPMPINEAVIDYQIIGQSVNEGVEQIDVVLVASPLKVVEQYISVIKDAGLKPLVVDIQPLAIMRVLDYHVRWDKNKVPFFQQGNLLLLDLAADSTQINAFNHNHISLNRVVPVGGDSFTINIADIMGINFAEAEKIKIEKGVTALQDMSANYTEEEYDQKVFDEVAVSSENNLDNEKLVQATIPLLREILKEIRRTLDFYHLEFRNETINQIILTGGGSMLKGLPEILEETLGVKVITYNPLQFVKYRKKAAAVQHNASGLTKLIGLALRKGVK